MPSSYRKLVELADKLTRFHDESDFHVGEALQNAFQPFGDFKVTQRTPLIELKSNYGLSDLRDLVETTAGGSVTNTIGDGEYILTTSATANSRVVLSSAERGRYNPGYGAQAGLGLRLITTPTGSQVYKWGYFDDNNGFYFGYDVDGLFIARLDDGVETRVNQADWNENSFDGNGIYNSFIDPFEGEIWQIDFSWYGDGTINYVLVSQDARERQWPFVAHRLNPGVQPSVKEPNLPIRVLLDNGDSTGSALEARVAGRQFSIVGAYTPNRRVTSQHRFSATVSGSAMTSLIAFRRKSAYESVSVKLDGFEIITSGNIHYDLAVVDQFDSATYSDPTFTVATETAMQVTTDPSSAQTSISLSQGLVEAGGFLQPFGSQDRAGLGIDAPGFKNLALRARPIDGSQATVSVVLRVREEW